MRQWQIIILITLISVIPAMVGAAPEEPASATISISPVSGAVSQPSRDDNHLDSIYYEYGFEEGWNGWTTADLTNPGVKWHPSEQHAFEGSSWWCANPELGEGGGYDNHWLQYLITPTIDLSNVDDAQLTFNVLWAMEDPEVSPPNDPYDGWDGFNVWISVDGGEEWWVMEPDSPAYNYRSLYSFGLEWNMGPDIPGWCAFSDDWLDATFDLGDFAGEGDVRIRWAFCSDPGDATPDNDDYISVLVDNLTVTGDEEILWFNNGDEQGDMQLDTGPTSGDFWEISDGDSYSGEFSAHCPVEANLQNALISPPLEIPSDPWYTYFDFWVHPDAQNWDPEGDGSLNDYFTVDYSLDGVEWEKIIHEYDRDQWGGGWHFIGPDTTFNDAPEWKRKLNLTGFGGETVYLRWKAITDNEMGDNEGTGLWIDDFRLNITSRRATDVRCDWLHVGYPTTMEFNTNCRISLTNLGILDQDNVRQYYRVGFDRQTPIVPWGPLFSDDTREVSFRLRTNYADRVNISGIAYTQDDQEPSNDRYTISDVIVYPEGIWALGYDTRAYQYALSFDQGSGPAVLYTPEDDGIDDEFDIVALRVRWNRANNNSSETNLFIFADDGGEPGEEIYTMNVEVVADDKIPNEHVIDLSEVEELKGLNNNFWVWFEILNDDNEPSVVGNDEMFSEGHYFKFDGQSLEDRNLDFQIHPILMPAGADWTALVAGRDEMDFEEVQPESGRTIQVALFNGGTTEVTIENFEIDNDAFNAKSVEELPFTLRIGDFTHLLVEFLPTSEGEVTANLTINSDAGFATVVELIGVGDVEASAPDEDATMPTVYSLGEAFPNPFNSQAVIPYSLPRAENITLEVFDLNGRKVADLFTGYQSAGTHTAVFNGADFSAGVFVYRLRAGNFEATNKVVLVK